MGANELFSKYEECIRKAGMPERAEIISATLKQGRLAANEGSLMLRESVREDALVFAISANTTVQDAFQALEDHAGRYPALAQETYQGIFAYNEELIPKRHNVLQAVLQQAVRVTEKLGKAPEDQAGNGEGGESSPGPTVGEEVVPAKKTSRKRVKPTNSSDDEFGFDSGDGKSRRYIRKSTRSSKTTGNKRGQYNLRDRSGPGPNYKVDSSSEDEKEESGAAPLTQERREQIKASKIKAEDSGEVVVLDD